MSSTPSKSDFTQSTASDNGSEVFLITIIHAPRALLDLKTLRLVCKEAKAAANSRIRKLTVDAARPINLFGPPASVLESVRHIEFDCRPIADEEDYHEVIPEDNITSLLHNIVVNCASHLERLHLTSGLSLTHTAALGELDWPQLTYLSFHVPYNRQSESFEFLRRIPALTAVCCFNLASAKSLDGLADALEAVKPKLKMLHVAIHAQSSEMEETRAAVSKLLTGVPALTDFLIINYGFELKSTVFDFNSAAFVGLEKLSINRLRTLSLRDIAATPKPRLRSLTIEHCSALSSIESLKSFSMLKSLSLEECELATEDYSQWAGLASLNLPHLKTFKLKVRIQESGMKHVSTFLAKSVGLEELKLCPYYYYEFGGHFQIEDAVEALFSANVSLPRLKSLTFGMNTDALCIIALKRWHRFPNLTTLTLDTSDACECLSVTKLAGVGLAGAWPSLQKINISFRKDYHEFQDYSQLDDGTLEIEDSKGLPLSEAWAESVLQQAWPRISVAIKVQY